MPNGININGVFVMEPGTYGSFVVESSGTGTAPYKNIGLIADLPFLEQYAVTPVFSEAQMKALSPSDMTLATLAQCIYSNANDDRVGPGPDSVVLINARPVTQAYLYLVDGAAANTILLKSTVWGPKGNQTLVTVDRTGTGSSSDPFQYTFTVARDGYEDVVTAEGLGLFTVRYTAAEPFSAVLLNNNPNGEFAISGTDSAVAIGTQAYGNIWDGGVSVLPSTTPAASETYTITVTGKDAQTGISGVTSVITYAPAEAPTTKSTADDGTPPREFSYLTSITFAQAGGVPTSPTFTVTGDFIRVTAETVPTAGQLADILGATSPASGFTVTAVSDLAGSVYFNQIDPAAAVNITAATTTLHNTQQAIVQAFAGSGLVTAEAVTGGGAPVASTIQNLSGGSQSALLDTYYNSALTASRQVPIAIITALSESATVHGYVRDHVKYMSGPGRNPRNAWCGATANETVAQLSTRTSALNSRNVSLVFQEIKRPNPVTSQATWLTPKYWALQCAAIQASTLRSVTYVVPNVDGVRQATSIDTNRDANQLLRACLVFVGNPVNGQSPVLPRIIRAVTTYRISNDAVRGDVKPNESMNTFINYADTRFVDQIGEPTTAPDKILTGYWRQVGQDAVTLGIIAEIDEDTFLATRQGNVVLFAGKLVPVFSQDFMVFALTATPNLNGGGFNFNLSGV